MDPLAQVALVVLAGFIAGALALAFALGRWVERTSGEVKMLRATVLELHALLDESDYLALRALREYQRVSAEAARAGKIMDMR